MKLRRLILGLLVSSSVLLPLAVASAAPVVPGSSRGAEAFQAAMTATEGGVLLDNFPLAHWSYELDAQSFQRLAESRDALRTFVADRVLERCLAARRNASRCHAARRSLRGTWVVEERSGFVGAYRFATTFIAVAQDNWFSFEAVASRTMDYLSGGSRELHLYQSFDPTGVLVDGGVPLDELPVVVDHAERTITLWTATLFD
jgi:hypothetical protein